MPDIYIRYFLFSQEHHDKVKALEEKAGNKHYRDGNVIVAGFPKPYTAIVLRPEEYTRRFGDAKVVLCDDIRKVKYTRPSNN